MRSDLITESTRCASIPRIALACRVSDRAFPGYECAVAALSRGGGQGPGRSRCSGLAAGLPPYRSSRSQLLPPENQRATTRTSPAKAKTNSCETGVRAPTRWAPRRAGGEAGRVGGASTAGLGIGQRTAPRPARMARISSILVSSGHRHHRQRLAGHTQHHADLVAFVVARADPCGGRIEAPGGAGGVGKGTPSNIGPMPRG